MNRKIQFNEVWLVELLLGVLITLVKLSVSSSNTFLHVLVFNGIKSIYLVSNVKGIVVYIELLMLKRL